MLPFLRLAAILLLLCCQIRAGAAEPVPDDALAGHYYLRGATEVGSELLLKDSGQFEWVLVYGNVDMSARGNWRRDGQRVLLAPAAAAPMRFEPFFGLNLKKTPEQGVWVATVGVQGRGPVGGVEVRFVAKSGKEATAVTEPNGDAIVPMPASEQWTRAGLRDRGKGEWTWIDVPSEQAGARIAAFAVTNFDEAQPAPFKSLTLTIENGELVVGEGAGFRGAYAKQ